MFLITSSFVINNCANFFSLHCMETFSSWIFKFQLSINNYSNYFKSPWGFLSNCNPIYLKLSVVSICFVWILTVFLVSAITCFILQKFASYNIIRCTISVFWKWKCLSFLDSFEVESPYVDDPGNLHTIVESGGSLYHWVYCLVLATIVQSSFLQQLGLLWRCLLRATSFYFLAWSFPSTSLPSGDALKFPFQ